MFRALTAMLVLAGCSHQQLGADGPDAAYGSGYSGPQHCWDLDYDGEADPEEDTNGDGWVDVYDCRGGDAGDGAGRDGQACWDLDGDGVADPEEDTNGDGVVDVQDCRGDGTGAGSDAPEAIQVAVDAWGSCAVLTDGSVQCWGADLGDTMTGFSASGVVAIAMDDDGGDYRCEVLDDTSGRCWTRRDGYAGFEFASGVVELAIGQFPSVCALLDTGDVECVRGDGEAITEPTGLFSTIRGGTSGYCGLRQDGAPICWNLTDPYLREATLPTDAMSAIDVGGKWWACATDAADEIACWGREDAELPGDLEDQSKFPPAGTRCAEPALGDDHGCCIAGDGAALCWGVNQSGQANAPDGLTFSSLDASASHSCGVTTAGRVACWGGSNNQSAVPDALRPD